jgi:hypothetical protein
MRELQAAQKLAEAVYSFRILREYDNDLGLFQRPAAQEDDELGQDEEAEHDVKVDDERDGVDGSCVEREDAVRQVGTRAAVAKREPGTPLRSSKCRLGRAERSELLLALSLQRQAYVSRY